ncbi:MAG: Fe-S cluster protein [Candidatus Moranbacteria bacterium CG_4_9_14_3_um_filter_42_9]|nr:MAG: Fe-S cluster protein [Candidatus Moranbacteria bacterium CG_4_9_14_3_um_filter_42_9]
MDNLYKEELMEVYKNPPNRGVLKNPTSKSTGKNPMCGDEILLQLKIAGGKIADAKFDGSACAVSVISSALLTEHIIGKTIEEAKKLSKEDLLQLIGLNLSTSRVKCATLVLNALHDALEGL